MRRSPLRALLIECQCLLQDIPEAFQQFLTSPLLRVDARNLLDPPNPLLTVLLDNCRVCILHNILGAIEAPLFYTRTRRSRSEFVTTLTELNAIANAARMGLNCRKISGAQANG